MPFERPEFLSRISLIDFTYALAGESANHLSGLLEVVTEPLFIDLHLQIGHEHGAEVAGQRFLGKRETVSPTSLSFSSWWWCLLLLSLLWW